jgi:hypothetical protein
MATTRASLIKQINKRFPDIWMKPSEEFNGSKGAIWTGEGSDIDNVSAFEHYGYRDTMGIHPDLWNFLKAKGWHCEWYDGGTVFIYNDNY